MGALAECLSGRSLPGGGFGRVPGSPYRTDSTAWGAIALSAAGIEGPVLAAARGRLARGQGEDGRVALSLEHPDVHWPTALAALAWNGSFPHAPHRDRAIGYLLGTSGRHFERPPESPSKDNPSLRGWSWTEGAYSWVPPTAFALIAIRTAGHADHPRAGSAVSMLMDRQISGGGWNYGNTEVYGKTLVPQPDTTGIALCGLAGMVAEGKVRPSIEFLESAYRRVRTPYSLAWTILGLSAWNRRPESAAERIRTLFREDAEEEPEDTSLVALLLLSEAASGGIVAALTRDRRTASG